MSEKLCDCVICQKVYDVVDFVEYLIGDREYEAIKAAMPNPEKDRSKEALKGVILAGALAEFYFKHDANPFTAMECFQVMWNKRATLNLHGFTRSENDKKLEDYDS